MLYFFAMQGLVFFKAKKRFKSFSDELDAALGAVHLTEMTSSFQSAPTIGMVPVKFLIASYHILPPFYVN